MRVANWRGKQVFDGIKMQALAGARAIMDAHVEAAKALCPVGKATRAGGYKRHPVNFRISSGRRKGEQASFMAKTWMGRKPGSLRDTIRRVENKSRPGNIRVYAGNYNIYYARFVERGTKKMEARRYLEKSFDLIKPRIISTIQSYINQHPEVK